MIALFTDFGTRDAYVAQLKGAILSVHPTTSLIDLTHEIAPFNVLQAAYLLDISARYFPAGTIFVAVVDPGVGTARQPLLVQTQAEKFYLGPDNGLFTRVVGREGLQAAYELQHTAYFLRHVSTTFHGRDIFGPVAGHLALGTPPAHFGPQVETIVILPYTRPRREDGTILGEVVHLDHFGNIVTDVTPDVLWPLHPGQFVCLTLQEQTQRVPFVQTYGDASPGQLICLINSNDAFEIARVQGRATALIPAQVGDRMVLQRAG